ncbi:MAG: hypothetical protein WAJ95_12165, partial [Desulfobacterales bacterium]
MPIHGIIKGTDWFPIQNSPFSASSRKSAALRGGVLVSAAQEIPPIDAEIAEKGHLWTETNELVRAGLVDLAYGVKSSKGAGNIPLDKLNTRAIPEGLAYGLQFMTRDDPNVFEPLKIFKPLFLRFSKRSDDDPRAKRLRKLLNLDPAKYSFGIV